MHLAFVLLPKEQLPPAEAVTRAFERFASPGQSLRVRQVSGGSSAGTQMLEFVFSPGGQGVIALMPSAVPNREAEEAARFSLSALGGRWTPPAHRAHLVVTCNDADSASASASLTRFTAVVAAVTQAADAVGVYWGGAPATHDSEFVVSVAEEKDVRSLLMLWTGVSVAREGDGRLSLVSLGMRQLGLPDLWLIAPPSSEGGALACFFDLLGFASARGAAPAEGETVGRTAEERWPVRYVKSPVDPQAQVWRIEMQ
jgi:hypothetical protein